MKTRIVTFDALEEASYCLREGNPIVFPTETVYGLGALVFDEKAVRKIFLIKGRPADNPLIVHVSSVEESLSLVEEAPPAFFTLAHHFWPGPLSIVLRKNGLVPSLVSAGQPTVAIRMPAHEGALRLIQKVGQPIAAPSANLSGKPSPTKALDAWEDLQGRVPLIIDGGPCQIGIESTVVSLAHASPMLLRPGAVSQAMLEDVLQTKVALPHQNTPLQSPGMKYRHYAPKACVRLAANPAEIGLGSFVLSLNPNQQHRKLHASTFYACLREADRLGHSEILIDCSGSFWTDVDPALLNRLLHAAGGSIPFPSQRHSTGSKN